MAGESPLAVSLCLISVAVGRVAFWFHHRRQLKRYVETLMRAYPENALVYQRKAILEHIRKDLDRKKITEEFAAKAGRWVQDRLAARVIETVGALQGEDECEPGLDEAPEVEGATRPTVRRGRRWNAAYEIYVRCVGELGRKPHSPAQSDTVSNVARRFMKEMNVRHSDIPKLLPLVVVMYFTPTEEDLMAAAVLNSLAHKRLRAEVEVKA